jgi:hypothetical protein
MPRRMLGDNMGTNKHIESHLKRPKKMALKGMLRIWHHIKGREKHDCQKMLKKTNSSKGDVGKYDKGTKKDVEWHCEGHHIHKKKVNLNLCPYIKITIGLKRHLQNYHYKGHQEDSWDVPRLGTSFLTTLLMWIHDKFMSQLWLQLH